MLPLGDSKQDNTGWTDQVSSSPKVGIRVGGVGGAGLGGMLTADWTPISYNFDNQFADVSANRFRILAHVLFEKLVAPKLTVFKREPGWVNPKPATVYDDAQRRALTRPWRYRLERIRGYRETSKSRHGGDIHIDGSPANTAARERCERYIAEVFADRPDLQKLVTPDYPYFGKRPIKDSNYYPALKRDNVELVPRAVIEVTETGVIDADGVEHDIDVLIMSTGFQPSRYLAQLPVTGRGGLSLQDSWGDEPSAFLGITVPGFPNFFMLYGPNTNSPTVLFQLERQAEFAISAIRWVLRKGAREIEVLPWAHDVYNIWLQWQMRDSVWATSNNYFKSPTGRVVTQWPVSPTLYWLFTKTLLRPSSRLT